MYDPEDIYEKITLGILEAAEETLPSLESPKHNWMSSEMKLAIDKQAHDAGFLDLSRLTLNVLF